MNHLQVGTSKDITEESVSLFHMLEPRLGNNPPVIPVPDHQLPAAFHSFSSVAAEILVLGTGAKLEQINPSVLALLKKKGIAVEIQDTVNVESALCPRPTLISVCPRLCSQTPVQPSTS